MSFVSARFASSRARSDAMLNSSAPQKRMRSGSAVLEELQRRGLARRKERTEDLSLPDILSVATNKQAESSQQGRVALINRNHWLGIANFDLTVHRGGAARCWARRPCPSGELVFWDAVIRIQILHLKPR